MQLDILNKSVVYAKVSPLFSNKQPKVIHFSKEKESAGIKEEVKEGELAMYRLLIDEKQWKDCTVSGEDDILYVAKTLSRFSRCQVDVYKSVRSTHQMVASFFHGKPYRSKGEIA